MNKESGLNPTPSHQISYNLGYLQTKKTLNGRLNRKKDPKLTLIQEAYSLDKRRIYVVLLSLE